MSAEFYVAKAARVLVEAGHSEERALQQAAGMALNVEVMARILHRAVKGDPDRLALLLRDAAGYLILLGEHPEKIPLAHYEHAELD